MQYVPGFKLMAGRAQDMLSRYPGRSVQRRQHVLQLVTETVGAAGLIKAGPAPYTTGKVLIEQPAIEQEVRGAIRCLDGDTFQ
jgi:hypothetical protein